MGLVNPAMPSVGSDPRGTGESTLNNGLTALLNEFNGNIESSNVKDGSLTVNDLGTGANGPAIGAFSAYRSATLSLTNLGIVVFDTELFDVSGWFDVATGVYTPQVAGYYRLSWGVMPNAALTADNFWTTQLEKNAATLHQGNVGFQRAAANFPGSVGSVLVQANGTTDAFRVKVLHNQGVAHAIANAATYTYFHGELVGRS